MATDGSVRTPRVRAKADRQAALLREAARLFAARGFDGVSLEDLGASVGVTGPAIYRHFSSKRALLGAILVRVSEELLDGGRTVEEETPDPTERLDRLIAFHVDFALSGADVIRVHDRELGSLSDADRRTVRTLQRTYVALWVDVLAQLHPERPRDDLREAPDPRPDRAAPEEPAARQLGHRAVEARERRGDAHRAAPATGPRLAPMLGI